MIPVCQKCNGEGKIETTTPENVKYKTYDPCQHCNGSGHDTEWVTCSDCGRDGESPKSLFGACLECPTCDGHGQVRKVTHDGK